MGIPGKKEKQTRKKVRPPDNRVDRFGVNRMRCKHQSGDQTWPGAAESADNEEEKPAGQTVKENVDQMEAKRARTDHPVVERKTDQRNGSI
jgi:hypothetical protein